MAGSVDLYDSSYGNYDAEMYREVRVQTYGEDLGQTSWVSTEESNEIPQRLELRPESAVLELGCGSGRYALQLAEVTGCRISGLDINGPGISTANKLARARGMDSRVCFEQCDISQPLPFDDQSFDAAFSNDALCHIPHRPNVLGEIWRVLRPGGRLLFSDALVIGGIISREEIITRSSIGYYLFSPPGENERLLERAGFRLLAALDTTESAARISSRWYHARREKQDALAAAEGELNFEGVQKFLACVHTLTSERRLLRLVYVAVKG